jgi:hypothetical protein
VRRETIYITDQNFESLGASAGSFFFLRGTYSNFFIEKISVYNKHRKTFTANVSYQALGDKNEHTDVAILSDQRGGLLMPDLTHTR